MPESSVGIWRMMLMYYNKTLYPALCGWYDSGLAPKMTLVFVFCETFK